MTRARQLLNSILVLHGQRSSASRFMYVLSSFTNQAQIYWLWLSARQSLPVANASKTLVFEIGSLGPLSVYMAIRVYFLSQKPLAASTISQGGWPI